MNKTPKAEEYEHCVMCGALTNIPISMPIDWRNNYEIGLGQICNDCAEKLQSGNNRKNTLTYEQIILAMERSRIDDDKQ